MFPDFDLGDKLYDAYVSHNHPIKDTEFSFSKDDIMLFEKYNLKLLRGIDEKYKYELNNSGKVDTPSTELNDENSQLETIIIEAENRGVRILEKTKNLITQEIRAEISTLLRKHNAEENEFIKQNPAYGLDAHSSVLKEMHKKQWKEVETLKEKYGI